MKHTCKYSLTKGYESKSNFQIKLRTPFIILVLLVIMSTWLICETPDSCLKLLKFPQNSGNYNPDSIKVDSCQGSPTYSHFFAKKFFTIQFEYSVLPRAGVFPKDTIIEYSWHEIDSIYSSTKAGFQELEKKFGIFLADSE